MANHRKPDPVPVADYEALAVAMLAMRKFALFRDIETSEWNAFAKAAPRCQCGGIPAPKRIVRALQRDKKAFVFCCDGCRQAYYHRLNGRVRDKVAVVKKNEAREMADAFGRVV